MNFWIYFWTVLFFASVSLFAILTVAVTIGGFFNIRSLLKGLTDKKDQQEENSSPGEVGATYKK